MSEVAHAEVYWPGPTRLYDPDVDAGAVLMTGERPVYDKDRRKTRKIVAITIKEKSRAND